MILNLEFLVPHDLWFHMFNSPWEVVFLSVSYQTDYIKKFKTNSLIKQIRFLLPIPTNGIAAPEIILCEILTLWYMILVYTSWYTILTDYFQFPVPAFLSITSVYHSCVAEIYSLRCMTHAVSILEKNSLFSFFL